MLKYAGIGSRQTPLAIQSVMIDFAYALARDAIMRSGGAPGADIAFEFGASTGGGLREIFLPWKGFNGYQDGILNEPSEAAYDVAEYYHPGWKYLKQGAKKLIARNSHQVLGEDLDDPIQLVVCWTPDGSLDGTGRKSGGTGQALRIAADWEIDVWNLQRPEHLTWVKETVGHNGMLNCYA